MIACVVCICFECKMTDYIYIAPLDTPVLVWVEVLATSFVCCTPPTQETPPPSKNLVFRLVNVFMSLRFGEKPEFFYRQFG